MGQSKAPVDALIRWQKEYNDGILNLEKLKKKIAIHLAEYERKEVEEVERRKQMEGTADDEGWITVVNPKKRRLIPTNSNKFKSRKRSTQKN